MTKRFFYLCHLLWVAGTFGYYGPIYIVRLLVWGALDSQEKVRHYCRQILRSAGQSLRIIGELPSLESGPVIYIFDHSSLLDTFVVGALLTGRFTAAVAKEYMSWLLIGRILRMHHCIAIDRSNPDSAKESLLQEGAKAIEDGFSIVGFPEGTRTKDGFLQKLKKGLFYLAQETGARIVPIHIEGAFQAANRRDWSVNKGEIVVCIGQAIDPRGLTIDEMADRARKEFIRLGAKEKA